MVRSPKDYTVGIYSVRDSKLFDPSMGVYRGLQHFEKKDSWFSNLSFAGEGPRVLQVF